MKKVFLWIRIGIIVVIAITGGQVIKEIIGDVLGWNDDQETRTHKMLEEVAEKWRKDCATSSPASWCPPSDEYQTMVDAFVTPAENKLTYQFVMDNNIVIDKTAIENQRQRLQDAFCNGPEFQGFREGNVVMVHSYKSADGNVLASIETGNFGCE